MAIGDSVKNALSGFRNQFGGLLTFSGTDYACIMRTLEPNDVPEELLEGGRNVANADLRVFNTGPEFPGQEADIVTWEGQDYTISRVSKTVVANTVTALRLVCFRLPQPASATAESVGEPDPGQRKPYYPPANTH